MNLRFFILSILVLLIINFELYGIQTKTGIISTKEVWSGVVQVTGDVIISQNAGLIISPGTIVKFEGKFFIKVIQNGKIYAVGTSNNPIKFIPSNNQIGWAGIKFENMLLSADSSIFDFCTFKYSTGAVSIKKFNKIRIDHCVFSNNSTTLMPFVWDGGGVCCDSSFLKVYNSVFQNNFAGNGGGLFFRGSNAHIRNTRITGNTMYFSGAGIYSEDSYLNIVNCSIDSNYHGNSGGGAGLYSQKSDITLTNCKLINNKRNAIYCMDYYGGKLKLINSLVANNEGSHGGGLCCYGISLTVINSTIVNNKGDVGLSAGGIYCADCTPLIIYNSILWNNSGAYPDLFFNNGYPVIRNCGIKDGNLLNIPDSLFINNISNDPKFVNPSSNIGYSNDAMLADWSFRECSPCINSGDNSLIDPIPLFDLLNHPRVYNDTIDMGAIEFQNNSTPTNGTKIIYVKQGGTGDGSSWLNASGNLQSAMNTPLDCYEAIEVWVAAGTYFPDISGQTDARNGSFYLKNNVKVYGGFNGDETNLNLRNWKLNSTILSGDIGILNEINDNVYHVVFAESVDASSVLDGFVILKGNAKYPSSIENGGGIYCYFARPELNNLMIRDNAASSRGGGIYLYYSDPKIYNSLIYNNLTYGNGGGLYLENSNAVILNSQVINNKVLNGFAAGGIYLQYSNPHIINSIIANNENNGVSEGGGIYCESASPVIINSIFANNKCSKNSGGAGIFVYSNSNPVIYNSIFLNNRDGNVLNHFAKSPYGNNSSFKVFSSLIQGGNSYNIPVGQFVNNFDAFPRFVKPSVTNGLDIHILEADWRILSCSPCVNRGKNSYFPQNIPIDMANNERIYNGTIDVDPFEYHGDPSGLLPENIVHVFPGGTGNGVSWNEAIGNLQNAIDLSPGCYQTSELWVAAGTYIPDTEGLSDNSIASFVIRNNTNIYGGFAGNRTSLDQRELSVNISVLSGNIGNPDISTDNSNNVVTILDQDSVVVLDGFTIQNGYCDNYYKEGAAIYGKGSNFILKNLNLSNNFSTFRAGALYSYGSEVSVENSMIATNFSNNGGALFLENSQMRISNCKIINNSGDDLVGGINLKKVKGYIFNCVISNNDSFFAGAIASEQSNYTIANSTLTNNRCFLNGPGIINTSDTLFLINSIIWNYSYSGIKLITFTNGNLLRIKNCNIQNGSLLNLPVSNYVSNIDAYPKFMEQNYDVGNSSDALISNWSIKSCSPCIDNGSNNPEYLMSSIDMSGNPRIFENGTVDIGAYEYQGIKRCLTVKFKIKNGELPVSGCNVYINQSIFLITNSNGECILSDNSVGDKISFVITYGSTLLISNTIESLLNDMTINFNFNDIAENINSAEFLIYPNPMHDFITLETNVKSKGCNMIIYTLDGQMVIQQHLTDNKTVINLSSLVNGIYFVKLMHDRNIEVKKIMKE